MTKAAPDAAHPGITPKDERGGKAQPEGEGEDAPTKKALHEWKNDAKCETATPDSKGWHVGTLS